MHRRAAGQRRRQVHQVWYQPKYMPRAISCSRTLGAARARCVDATSVTGPEQSWADRFFCCEFFVFRDDQPASSAAISASSLATLAGSAALADW